MTNSNRATWEKNRLGGKRKWACPCIFPSLHVTYSFISFCEESFPLSFFLPFFNRALGNRLANLTTFAVSAGHDIACWGGITLLTSTRQQERRPPNESLYARRVRHRGRRYVYSCARHASLLGPPAGGPPHPILPHPLFRQRDVVFIVVMLVCSCHLLHPGGQRVTCLHFQVPCVPCSVCVHYDFIIVWLTSLSPSPVFSYFIFLSSLASLSNLNAAVTFSPYSSLICPTSYSLHVWEKTKHVYQGRPPLHPAPP